jgi:hypothetical protein
MKVPQHVDQLDEEKMRRKRLQHSLLVVVCLWAGVALIVTVNVTVNGVSHFYGPTEYCKPYASFYRSDFDMTQGVGFSPSIQSSGLLAILH